MQYSEKLQKLFTLGRDGLMESKKLDYADGTKLDQINLVASYKTNINNRLKINTLVHQISNDTNDSDGTQIVEIGETILTILIKDFDLSNSICINSSNVLNSGIV